MSNGGNGGERHWNEDTQRWEADVRPATAAASPHPPAGPQVQPMPMPTPAPVPEREWWSDGGSDWAAAALPPTPTPPQPPGPSVPGQPSGVFVPGHAPGTPTPTQPLGVSAPTPQPSAASTPAQPPVASVPAEPPGSAPTTPVLPVADGGTVWPPTPGQAPASGQVLAAPARPSVASVPAEPPGSAPTTPVLPVADGGTVWPPTPGQTPASGQVLAAPARPSVASVPAEPPGSAPTTPVLPVADGGTAWPPTPGQTPASGQVLAAPGQVPVSGWSFVEQFPAPVLSRRRDRRLVWSVVVGAAVVGVATSLVLTLVVGKGDGPKPATAAASVTPTSSARPGVVSESPSDTGSPSPSASAPPVGYELRDDTEGFRIAVPDGWSRSTVDSSYGMAVVSYRSADREHRLQVYQVAEESPAASHELYLSAETPKPDGFRELGLTDLDDGRFTGSRLEYLAGTISGEPDIGTWHVFDERFVAPDGNIYAVASYGPDSDGRGDELAYLTTAVDWFCPPDTVCDTDPAAD